MPLGLSFDFWNTLFADGREPLRHTRRMERLHAESQKYRPVEMSEVEQVMRASSEYFHREWQEHQRTPTAKERLDLMTGLLSIRFTTDQTAETVEYFGNLIFEVPPEPLPYAGKLIRNLSRSHPLGIISDTGYISGRHIRLFLAQQDLLHCFTSLIFSDEHENSKPHVSVFQKTAANLGVETGQLIHTGDLERTDINGARNAGCGSIRFTGAVASAAHNSEADQIIGSYQQYMPAVRRICQDAGNHKAG